LIAFSAQDVILVTGASSGIGRATAELASTLGATLIISGRDRERLALTKKGCRQAGRTFIEPMDLLDQLEHLDTWVPSLSQKYGPLKGMVCCAGERHTIPLLAVSLARMERLYRLNLFAGVFLAKGFARAAACGSGDKSIVFISSLSAEGGGKGLVDYSGSKAALNSAVKCMAAELAARRIRVNSILPGFVNTELLRKDKNLYTENLVERINREYPLGIGAPGDVAQMACYLLSDCSRWITGSQLVLDGGASLR